MARLQHLLHRSRAHRSELLQGPTGCADGDRQGTRVPGGQSERTAQLQLRSERCQLRNLRWLGLRPERPRQLVGRVQHRLRHDRPRADRRRRAGQRGCQHRLAAQRPGDLQQPARDAQQRRRLLRPRARPTAPFRSNANDTGSLLFGYAYDGVAEGDGGVQAAKNIANRFLDEYEFVLPTRTMLAYQGTILGADLYARRHLRLVRVRRRRLPLLDVRSVEGHRAVRDREPDRRQQLLREGRGSVAGRAGTGRLVAGRPPR